MTTLSPTIPIPPDQKIKACELIQSAQISHQLVGRHLEKKEISWPELAEAINHSQQMIAKFLALEKMLRENQIPRSGE